LEGLKVEPVDEKLRRCTSDWLWQVPRMNNNRMPKIVMNFRSNGRRRHGRPLERLLEDAETGLSRPNSWRMMAIYIYNKVYTLKVLLGTSAAINIVGLVAVF